MKRLVPILAPLAVLTLPQSLSAQTSVPLGNNPTVAGIYVEGMLGGNIADETEFDFDNDAFNDFDVDPDAGILGGVAVGYNLPQGQLNIRVEGELAGRANEVDELDAGGAGVLELDNADISSVAGMANAYLDFYFSPNMALTVGAGVGYANVKVDFDVIDDDASGFAYQGRLGARYNLSGSSAITAGYTYFSATELEVDDEDGDELQFDYENHGFHLGFAYHF